MFKLIVLSAVLAIAAASPIVLPYHGYPTPIVKAAVPVATSYANTYRVSSPLVAPAFAAPAFAAPAFAAPAFAAPAAVAAPAFPASVLAAPAPVAVQAPTFFG